MIDDFADIRHAETGMTVWQRTLPLAIAQALDALAPERLPDFRILVDTSDVGRAVAIKFREIWPDNPPLAAWLCDDVSILARRFAAIVDERQVDIRMERISGNSCWRFHRDCVSARLLCTYRGQGTQWVPDRWAREALKQQDRYRGPLNELSPHAVAVFKGSCSGAGAGVVHRSPPIAGTGQTRLLLCLNAPSGASPPHMFA